MDNDIFHRFVFIRTREGSLEKRKILTFVSENKKLFLFL